MIGLLLRRTYLVGAVIAVCSAAPAQVVKSKSGYLFRMQFVQGQIIHFKSDIAPTLGGKKMFKVLLPMKQTIAGVRNGVADLVLSIGPATVNGKILYKENVLRQQVSTRGQLEGGQSGANSGITTYPVNAVKVGQRWTATVPVSTLGTLSGGAANVFTTYRLVRVKKLDGKPVAELHVKFTSEGSAQISGEGETDVLIADGWIYRSVCTMNVALAKGTQPFTVSVTVNRY